MAHGRKHRERPHKPHEFGARIFDRGRWKAADLRPWGGGRVTLRNPKHPDWPGGGERLEAIAENEEMARRWAWEYVDLLRQGERSRLRGEKPVGPALGASLDAWLRHRERDYEDNTYRSNVAIAGHLRAHFGEDCPTRQVTAERLQDLFDGLLRAGYRPSTLATERAVISAFFRWLDVEPNPARKVTLPAVPRSDVVAWTDAQMETLRHGADAVDAARGGALPSARLALELALATGARQQELFALEWGDFDADEKTVRIRRQLTRYGGNTKPLKGKEARTVLVLPDWFRGGYHREGMSGTVLAHADGSPLRYRASWLLGQRILDTAELNVVGRGWHLCRHTYARRFLEGVRGDVGLLQKSLGHKSIRTTEAYYGHFYSSTAARLARAAIYGEPVLRVVE